MMTYLCTVLLTTFISVNGNVVEVPIDSPQAIAYEQNAVTDIGRYLSSVYENDATVSDSDIVTSVLPDTVVPDTSVTPDVNTYNSSDAQMLALLDESVSLLAENSSSVTGTVNSTVLNLMDRMVNSYPSHYKYAGFRTSADDSYQSVLYIAKRATVNGNKIQFSDDCIAVEFFRESSNNGYNSYVYYDVSDAPNATVDVTNKSIVYTNVLDGYPSLGTVESENTDVIWIIVLVTVVAIVMIKRRK